MLEYYLKLLNSSFFNSLYFWDKFIFSGYIRAVVVEFDFTYWVTQLQFYLTNLRRTFKEIIYGYGQVNEIDVGREIEQERLTLQLASFYFCDSTSMHE